MGRVGEPTNDAAAARRDESRLRELDRKTTRAISVAGSGARGELALMELPAAVTGFVGGTRSEVARLAGIPVTADRLYRVTAWLAPYAADGSTPTYTNVYLTYTLDGSTVAPASPILVQGIGYYPAGGIPVSMTISRRLPAGSAGQLAVMLCLDGQPGRLHAVAGSSQMPIQVAVADAGSAPVVAG